MSATGLLVDVALGLNGTADSIAVHTAQRPDGERVDLLVEVTDGGPLCPLAELHPPVGEYHDPSEQLPEGTTPTPPLNAQALALARLMRDRPGRSVTVSPGPFDLPDGYLLAVFDGGFTCGIAPDGAVSS